MPRVAFGTFGPIRAIAMGLNSDKSLFASALTYRRWIAQCSLPEIAALAQRFIYLITLTVPALWRECADRMIASPIAVIEA